MWLIGIITAIGLVATGGAIAYGATVDQIQPSVSDRLLGIGILVALAGGVAAAGFGALRSGVLVHRDGITVRNGWRSRRLAWDAIERFSLQPVALSTTGRVHLYNGEVLTTWGIQGPNRFMFPNSAEATEPIAQLSALLQERRSPADDAGP
ncbi:MAG: Bacterial domain [Solirubrobacteraceae bacterium]|jgi:hypothetical protein|nr:Bacterial domain [Solirubrobacteraceae bacterium]